MRDYILECDAATGATYVAGKDGRLYPEARVAAAAEAAAPDDDDALALLVAVDFGRHADGAARTASEARAAIEAWRLAWLRGEFDRLDAVDDARCDRRASTVISPAHPAVTAQYGSRRARRRATSSRCSTRRSRRPPGERAAMRWASQPAKRDPDGGGLFAIGKSDPSTVRVRRRSARWSRPRRRGRPRDRPALDRRRPGARPPRRAAVAGGVGAGEQKRARRGGLARRGRHVQGRKRAWGVVQAARRRWREAFESPRRAMGQGGGSLEVWSTFQPSGVRPARPRTPRGRRRASRWLPAAEHDRAVGAQRLDAGDLGSRACPSSMDRCRTGRGTCRRSRPAVADVAAGREHQPGERW
ncbi:MAG: hypothetical protein IPH80_33940 [Myxococcales bacterium]|nr:hypothetical protein [Myxococcales bacterium]